MELKLLGARHIGCVPLNHNTSPSMSFKKNINNIAALFIYAGFLRTKIEISLVILPSSHFPSCALIVSWIGWIFARDFLCLALQVVSQQQTERCTSHKQYCLVRVRNNSSAPKIGQVCSVVCISQFSIYNKVTSFPMCICKMINLWGFKGEVP